jgi:VCBS repeat-containing protein
VVEGDEQYQVVLTGNTTGGGYEAISVDTTPVETTITDNDNPPVAINDPDQGSGYFVELGNISTSDAHFTSQGYTWTGDEHGKADWTNVDSTGQQVIIKAYNADGSDGSITADDDEVQSLPQGSSPLVDSDPNDNHELGVDGSPRGTSGWPTQQIEYDSTTGRSEAIEIEFNGNLNHAHLELGHLIGNEHGGEVAHWYALLDGQIVAEGEVRGAGGASVTTPLDINTGNLVFNEIRLEAREYADGTGSSSDSSDFFIQSLYGSGPAEANGPYVVYEGDTIDTASDLNDAVHGVLYNDYDLDGDAISVIEVNGQPLSFDSNGNATVTLTYGTLTINQNGQFSYTATADLNPGEVVQEHFTYTIQDQYGNTLNLTGGEGANVASDGDSVATTTITVIGRGNASSLTVEDDSATATEDGHEFIATEDEADDGQAAQGNVLSNDSGTDLKVTTVTHDGQTYTVPTDGSDFTITTQYGSLAINNTGAYTFTVNETAADTLNIGDQQTVPFTYTVEDSSGDTASAGLSITVEGRDDAPQIVSVSENDQPYHQVDGLLDTDHDGTPDTFTPDMLINQNNPDLRFNEDNGNIRIDMGNGNSSMAVNYWGGTAGYLNVIGFYEKDANGNIVDTQIIHSDNDPGFDYYSSPINLGTLNNLSHEVGFFIIPNGYADSNAAIKNAIDNGWQAQIDPSTGKITFVNPNDSSQTVEANKVYYTDNNLSTDGRDHAIIGVNDDGSLTIGFEDMPENITDQDYDDVVLTISACQTLSEGNHIFSTVDLQDVDNQNLQSATLTITNAQPEDTVAADNLPAGVTLTSNYSNGALQVTLSGSASVEDYEAALQALTFESSSSDRTPRDIELQVFDGTKHSNVSAFTLDIGGCTLNTYDNYPEDNPQDDNSVIARDDYGLSEQGEVILETGGGLAGKPDVAALEDGGYVIAWTEQDPNKHYQHDVYLQRFDVNGEPVTPPQLVNTFTEGDQYDVNVTSLTGGRYLVTWTANDLMYLRGLDNSDSDDGGSQYIEGQIFDENGQPVCHEFTVARAGYDPIVGLPDGGFVVSWTADSRYDNTVFDPDTSQNPIISDAHDGDGLGIVAQRFDAYGNPVGDRVIVNTTTQGNQLDSDIVLLADGSAIMTWQSVASDGDVEIMAQKLVLDDNAGLVKSGEEINISSNDQHDQTNPSITALPNGSAVIVWQSDDVQSAIAFRIVNADGTLGDEVVVSTGRHSAENPVITAGDNGFVIAWEEGWKLYTQSFNLQGEPNGDRVIAAWDDNPAIATLADGSYVLAHESAGGHIAYQRFNADGTPFEQTSFALDEDSSITINVADILANDSDPEGDSFTIESVQNPQHGTVVFNADEGTITFTPDPDYNGPATFDYTIVDERGATDTATVHLLVKPQGEPTVFVGTTCDADIHGTNVVVNEGEDVIFGVRLSGVEPGSTVTLTLSDGTAIDSDYNEATFQYSFDGTNWHDVTGPIAIPDGARGLYVKTDTVDDTVDEENETFNLTATLSTGQSATGTATILDNDGEAPKNTAPATTDDAVITCEDRSYTFTLNDFGQFSDAEGDSLAKVKIESLPENGQLLLNGQVLTAGAEVSAADIQQGELVFEPAHNTDEDSTFAFRVSDGSDWSDQHNVTVDVKAVADVPNANIELTRLEDGHANNGWGNGDQDAPGNSGGNNNAENAGEGSSTQENNGSDNYTSYKVDLSATVTDTDGSEHLSSVTISNIPAGAQLFDADGNQVMVTNGTATVPVSSDTQSLQDSWTLKVPNDAGDFSLTLTAVSSEGATGEDVCELGQTATAEDSDQGTVVTDDGTTDTGTTDKGTTDR